MILKTETIITSSGPTYYRESYEAPDWFSDERGVVHGTLRRIAGGLFAVDNIRSRGWLRKPTVRWTPVTTS